MWSPNWLRLLLLYIPETIQYLSFFIYHGTRLSFVTLLFTLIITTQILFAVYLWNVCKPNHFYFFTPLHMLIKWAQMKWNLMEKQNEFGSWEFFFKLKLYTIQNNISTLNYSVSWKGNYNATNQIFNTHNYSNAFLQKKNQKIENKNENRNTRYHYIVNNVIHFSTEEKISCHVYVHAIWMTFLTVLQSIGWLGVIFFFFLVVLFWFLV